MKSIAIGMALAAAISSAASARTMIVHNSSSEIVTFVQIDGVTWYGRILPYGAARVAEITGCYHEQYAEGTNGNSWHSTVNVCNGNAGPWTWELND